VTKKTKRGSKKFERKRTFNFEIFFFFHFIFAAIYFRMSRLEKEATEKTAEHLCNLFYTDENFSDSLQLFEHMSFCSGSVLQNVFVSFAKKFREREQQKMIHVFETVLKNLVSCDEENENQEDTHLQCFYCGESNPIEEETVMHYVGKQLYEKIKITVSSRKHEQIKQKFSFDPSFKMNYNKAEQIYASIFGLQQAAYPLSKFLNDYNLQRNGCYVYGIKPCGPYI
jgi:hypothetical protein